MKVLVADDDPVTLDSLGAPEDYTQAPISGQLVAIAVCLLAGAVSGLAVAGLARRAPLAHAAVVGGLELAMAFFAGTGFSTSLPLWLDLAWLLVPLMGLMLGVSGRPAQTHKNTGHADVCSGLFHGLQAHADTQSGAHRFRGTPQGRLCTGRVAVWGGPNAAGRLGRTMYNNGWLVGRFTVHRMPLVHTILCLGT